MNRTADTEPLPRRFARFARNAAGLTNIAAGGLAVAAYFLGTLIGEAGAWVRYVLAATPFLWIGIKELLRHRYASMHPGGEEPIGQTQRQWQRLFTAMAVLIGGMVVVVGVVSRADPSFPAGRALPLWLYFAFGLAVPAVVWRFVRTMEEMLVGLFLVVQAAMFLVGTELELGAGIQMPIAAAVAILLGFKQHADYRQLVSEAERLGE